VARRSSQIGHLCYDRPRTVSLLSGAPARHSDTAEEEIERIFGRLAQGGTVFMPLAAYPFSPLFAWVADQFGVSWQLLLDDQAR